MTVDTRYEPIPFEYKSRGLSARAVTDAAPPGTYLNLMNCLERSEGSMSSRYGTKIITRDPDDFVGGGSTYIFDSPVNSLARMTYLGMPHRYAGLESGNLWRRDSDTQGPYTNIYQGLSGQPFETVATNCFQSSQSYLFIYDANVSIKDSGLATPQLTGIDPSPVTLNTLPFSPLLTLIDNFAAGNTYTTNGFSAAWAYSPLVTYTTSSSQIVTDFPEFLNVNTSNFGYYYLPDGSSEADVTGVGTQTTSTTFAGFTSMAVTSTQVVSLSVDLDGAITHTGFATGSGTITISYSTNSGATWVVFYSFTGDIDTIDIGGLLSITVPGIVNLDTVQFKLDTTITTLVGSTGTASTAADLTHITAVITPINVFGPATNGMLSILGTGTNTAVPIVSATAVAAFGPPLSLLVVTQSAHGYSVNDNISIYASSNDLVDGFYPVTSVPSTTSFTVDFIYPTLISSVGGFANHVDTTPSTCVLINEYAYPNPTQMSAWGFYQQVPLATTSFPLGNWTGTVAQNTTAMVGATIALDLSQSGQVTDDDLICLCIAVADPAAIASIRLQFDVASSSYSSSYYYKDLAPTFYQEGVQALQDAYTTTEQQIFADTLGLISGQPLNSTTAQLQPGNISTGQNAWKTIYLRRGDFVAVGTAGDAGLDWGAVTGWQLVITTSTVGSTPVSVNGLYLQWGYGPSSFGGEGYDYRATYFNAATGTESNGTPIQVFNEQFGYLASEDAPFFLRQAVQLIGDYSLDLQVTHVRIYRRGGTFGSNWFQIDQFPNYAGFPPFRYKDVIPDAVLAEASTLVLDNDPPVTSSLQNPIATTLSLATSSPGNSIYSKFTPQLVVVQQSNAVFVPDQIVDVGYATALEQVRVIIGGTGQFTAIIRLQHNAGEPVNVFSIPRQPCDLCALAYDQVWLAGDPANPNYLYYSKKNRPESFGPQNYIKVGSSGDTIMAIVNWRGTLFVATEKTWYSIVGGSSPYPQPTGSIHGVVAKQGWTQAESAIWFRSADGWREFTGGNAAYATLPVELIFKPNPTPPLTPVPLADVSQMSQDVFAFYNNTVLGSYISTDGNRYRLAFDVNYKRFRNDDLAPTAMLWERDTNVLLMGVKLSGENYVIVQDQVGDYDDGGWQTNGAGQDVLVKTSINVNIQQPYQDLGKPHFPKQFNVLESDVDTAGQVMNTTLLFDTEPPTSVVLAPATTTVRNKVQLKVNSGFGVQAYSMSLQHTMAVTVAATFYQENIYAAVLAAYRSSFDTYWLKFGSDETHLVKQCYFDYTSSAPIIVNIYADGNMTPYHTFTLPTNTGRTNIPIRVRFPKKKLRQFRCVGNSAGDYQFWNAPVLHYKAVKVGTGYANYEFAV